MENVAVIGGGVAGLALTYRLLKNNYKVTVFERNKEVGGQLHSFPIEGENTEIFYHHTFMSDTNFIDLCKELNIHEKLQWHESTMAYYADKKQYSFGTPIDILRFSPLKFLDKVKFVISILRLQRMKDINKVNKFSAQEWFYSHGYKNVWEVIWEPLFKLKFAEKADEISLVWLWDKLIKRGNSRAKKTETEKLCYMEGSFCNLAIALKEQIIKLGGEIRTNTGIKSVEKKGINFNVELLDGKIEQFKNVVSTLSTKHHQSICEPENTQLLVDYQYQAAICVLLVLDKPYSKYYWTNIGDYSIPFGGIIEHTNFVGKDKYNGKSLVYLSRYLNNDSDFYKKNNDEILSLFLAGLKQIDNQFSAESVLESYVFKQEDAQPIVSKGYIPPKVETEVDGLYWISTHHVYPHDRGIEYAIEEANNLAKHIVAQNKG